MKKNFFNQDRIGFMQGRLVDKIKKKIQYFPDDNWYEEIKIAKLEKFNLMEWTINYENIKKNPLFNGKIKKLSEIISNNEFQIKSVTCDFFMQKPFFKEKLNYKKKQYLKDISNVIKNCNKLNFKYIILPLVDNSSISNINEEKELIQTIRKEIIPQLKNLKILFEIDYKPGKVLTFIKKFNSNKVGINYDTGNSASLNYNIIDEMKYFKFVKNIHIKDREKFGNTVRLGTGNWNYKVFFNQIKKINYKGNFILQTARSNNRRHIEELKVNKMFFLNHI